MNRRSLALDVFRGSTVFLMILVNNPGSWSHIYPILKHAAWSGLTPADLVFPFFILAVGMSIPLAWEKRASRGESNIRILVHIFLRSVFLVFVGILLNGFPNYNWDSIRIPGVLQRIGIVYFFTYLLFLYFREWMRIVFVLVVLVVYHIVIVYLPPPDSFYYTPLLSALSLQDGWNAFPYSPTDNYAAYWDRFFLNGHLWVYSRTWDPEGLLSTLPAIASGVFGLWIGIHLHHPQGWVALRGIGLVGIGWIWSLGFPIIKGLWTSSYVLVTAGLGYILFSCFSYLFGRDWTRNPTVGVIRLFEATGRIFREVIVSFGRHALVFFVLSGILSRVLAMDWGLGKPKLLVWENMNFIQDEFLRSFFYSWIYMFVIYGIFLLYLNIKKLFFSFYKK